MVFLLQACNRENAFDCAQRTGEIIVQKRQISPFYYLIVKDNIDVVLDNGNEQVAQIKAGKNLMPEIDLQMQGDTLIIANTNSCNWVRSFRHQVTVSLPVSTPDLTLVHRGYGEIKSNGTLSVNGLSIYSLDAGGNIDLQVEAGTVLVYSNSHAFVGLSGQADKLDIWMHKGIGRVYAENLTATNCVVKHEGSNEIRIFPLQESQVEILSSGNVAYYNEPVTMKSAIKGTGSLIER